MGMADSPVSIQALSRSEPSTPFWFGEVAVIAHALRGLDVLATIEERVRFARRRFGHYDLIDFVAVLLGYVISGERTLEAFYERVQPFAASFMALFGRERLPHRSTLSRFLAALGQAPVEALRTVFLEDLLARPLETEEKRAGCGTDKEHGGSCSTWMALDKQPANALCHLPRICPPPNVDWMGSVLLANTAQARGNRSDSDHCTPGPYASMCWHVFWGHRSWQR